MSSFPISRITKVHLNEFFRFQVPRSSYSSIFHLIMINSESMNIDMTTTLWNSFEYKICADGGANRLFDQLTVARRSLFVPDFIIGDLDSVRDEVKQFYSDLGTQVILDQNQDYNDFDKAIKLASTLQTVDETKTTATITTTTSADSTMTNTIPSSQRTVSLVALGAFGGRFDQEMSSIHALHKWKGTFDRIILLDKENAAFLLEGDDTHTTTHQVQCIDGIEGPTCGLLPLAGAANHVWTEGLHWNLNGDRLKMGELVSSSNYIEQSATIESQTSSQFESQSETKSETQSDSQMTKHARIDKDILTTHDTERVTVTTSADLVWVWNIKWPPIHT